MIFKSEDTFCLDPEAIFRWSRLFRWGALRFCLKHQRWSAAASQAPLRTYNNSIAKSHQRQLEQEQTKREASRERVRVDTLELTVNQYFPLSSNWHAMFVNAIHFLTLGNNERHLSWYISCFDFSPKEFVKPGLPGLLLTTTKGNSCFEFKGLYDFAATLVAGNHWFESLWGRQVSGNNRSHRWCSDIFVNKERTHLIRGIVMKISFCYRNELII